MDKKGLALLLSNHSIPVLNGTSLAYKDADITQDMISRYDSELAALQKKHPNTDFSIDDYDGESSDDFIRMLADVASMGGISLLETIDDDVFNSHMTDDNRTTDDAILSPESIDFADTGEFTDANGMFEWLSMASRGRSFDMGHVECYENTKYPQINRWVIRSTGSPVQNTDLVAMLESKGITAGMFLLEKVAAKRIKRVSFINESFVVPFIHKMSHMGNDVLSVNGNKVMVSESTEIRHTSSMKKKGGMVVLYEAANGITHMRNLPVPTQNRLTSNIQAAIESMGGSISTDELEAGLHTMQFEVNSNRIVPTDYHGSDTLAKIAGLSTNQIETAISDQLIDVILESTEEGAAATDGQKIDIINTLYSSNNAISATYADVDEFSDIILPMMVDISILDGKVIGMESILDSVCPSCAPFSIPNSINESFIDRFRIGDFDGHPDYRKVTSMICDSVHNSAVQFSEYSDFTLEDFVSQYDDDLHTDVYVSCANGKCSIEGLEFLAGDDTHWADTLNNDASKYFDSKYGADFIKIVYN